MLGRFGDAVEVAVFVFAVFSFHFQLNVVLDCGKFRLMDFENVEILFAPDKTLLEICGLCAGGRKMFFGHRTSLVERRQGIRSLRHCAASFFFQV
jgi:hypothetical protein